MDNCITILTKSDLNKLNHLQPDGWQDIVYYYNYYVQSNCCFPICIKSNNKIIAVGNAIINGNSGWLAHIIVDKNYRRLGLGYRITEKLIKTIKEKGCETLLLIASEEGEGLYKKFGFRYDGFYRAYQGNKLNLRKNNNIKEVELRKGIDEILNIDKNITKEDRSNFFNPLIKNIYVYSNPTGKILGFYLHTIGQGPIIADTFTAGIELLKYKHSLKDCQSVVPDSNKAAIRFFDENGFIFINKVARMYLGRRLEWSPDKVYSRAGGYIG